MAAKKHQTDVKVNSKKSHETRPRNPTTIPKYRKILRLEIHKDPTTADKYAKITKSMKGKLKL